MSEDDDESESSTIELDDFPSYANNMGMGNNNFPNGYN